MRRWLVVAALVFAWASIAAGWGTKGHGITGIIAEKFLTADAKAGVEDLIGRSRLVWISTWADVIRDEQPDTAPWHYVNIAPGAEGYERERDCADGRCVVEKIEEMKRVLVDPDREKTERVHALKWLVHLVGDVHQPLHCANAADRGGNSIHVTLDGERYNLHELWDSTVIERQHLDEGAYAKALIDEIRESDVASWQQGSAAEWATETWKLARTVAYVDERGEAIVDGAKLTRTYVTTRVPVIDEQLKKAGVRLAGLLNDAFKPAAPPK
ncbi:MAG: S1/P1 nuclease [Planctomycetes bacterium]|nr:S1/P1 nuclease [Planctomycetota bacterium]